MNNQQKIGEIYTAKYNCESKIQQAIEEFIETTNLHKHHQINIIYRVDYIEFEGSCLENNKLLPEVELIIKL